MFMHNTYIMASARSASRGTARFPRSRLSQRALGAKTAPDTRGREYQRTAAEV